MSWRTENPPMDGTEIVAVGRVTWSEECGGGSSPFCSAIKWDGNQWLHANTPEMSVARYDDERVHVDYWMPMPWEEAAL